jgi:hypothetical protein
MRILTVRQREDGYWYIGQGRSIAEGPFRRPEHVLAAASDLVASDSHWAIEVFDRAGDLAVRYDSDRLQASDFERLRNPNRWMS